MEWSACECGCEWWSLPGMLVEKAQSGSSGPLLYTSRRWLKEVLPLRAASVIVCPPGAMELMLGRLMGGTFTIESVLYVRRLPGLPNPPPAPPPPPPANAGAGACDTSSKSAKLESRTYSSRSSGKPPTWRESFR